MVAVLLAGVADAGRAPIFTDDDALMSGTRKAVAAATPPAALAPPLPPAAPDVATASVAIRGNVYWHTDPRFKSWNIDASPIRGWEVRNLSLPKLHHLAAASLPGYLRFGGSGNDGLVYGVGNVTKCPEPKTLSGDKNKTHCLNETHFRDFMRFSKASTARLIFGLNIDPRTASGNWDPAQARALMVYGRNHFGKDAFFGFELGNEQDRDYVPSQVATDFEILRDVIDEVWADVDPGRRPRLVGPDPHGFHSAPMDAKDVKKLRYLEEFAMAIWEKLPLFAFTHHEYVEVPAYDTHPPSAQVLDIVGGIAAQVNRTLRESLYVPATAMIFAGETGPHNGKNPGVMSDRSMRWANFADVFWYLNAMGSKAKRRGQAGPIRIHIYILRYYAYAHTHARTCAGTLTRWGQRQSTATALSAGRTSWESITG